MKEYVLKKRIIFVFVLVCISFVTYGIINMRRLPNQVAKTNSLPITNKIIVIDAGHGLPDERGHWF